MKSKNNEIKITIGSVAKATFIVLTGYKLGKWAADNLATIGRAIDHGIKKAIVHKIEEKEKEEEEKSDS